MYRCSPKIKITIISKRKPKCTIHFIRPVTDPAKSRQIPRDALVRPIPSSPAGSRPVAHLYNVLMPLTLLHMIENSRPGLPAN